MSDGKDWTGTPPETRVRCGFGQTLKGERCERPGAVRLMGLRLCQKHARRVEIEDQIALLLGIISSLELCMRNVSIRRNSDFTRSLQSRRANAAAELESARRELRRNGSGERGIGSGE